MPDGGWFGPAAALARRVDPGEPGTERARLVERRALAAEALLADVEHLLAAAMGDTVAWEPPGPDGRGRVESVPHDVDLDGLLARIASYVRRYGPALGWDADELADAVATSPRLSFGSFGTVLVPGPTFSRRDGVLGAGEPGERVPGHADVLDRLGRMGLFGERPFGGVDGTELRRLFAEERSGEHLGVPWNGMVLVCDGVDARGQRSREGLEISGAALHEGYWVDVGSERLRRDGWRAWQEFLARRGEAWARDAIAAFPLRCDVGLGTVERERERVPPMLGADDVLRLSILLDRSGGGAVPTDRDLVTLDELVGVVSTHEEGHLCDRERFLPLGRDLGGVVALAVSEAFSPIGIERRLEYRAELVALCEVPDPRLVLVDLLGAAAVDTRLETVHAHAYRRLLEDFLREWNRRLGADPSAWPDVSREHYLAHQLQLLSSDEVRSIAREVARREGLVGR
ncbi:MAG: hypothetical protein R3F34_00030 [Planctomycetota bacterium]